MGNSDETKTSKPEKPSSPPLEQTSIHVYPDWAAMQAYYGPRVAVPPYFNSAVAPGHAPHSYMWGPPQPMMAPYGSPYAAIYAHGGVYAHPGVSLAATPNPETPTKSSGTTDQGLMKKLKGFDGLAMSIGNGNADSAEGGANHTQSQSTETEGSSDGSNGNSAGAGQYGRKRSREETPTTGGDAKTESVPTGEVNGASDKVMVIEVPPSSVAGNVMGNAMALELKNPPNANAKASPTNVAQPYAIMPNETWLQNEREMKRERRKQSNRESARRSRLRKQAEAEELATRVKSLTSENTTLRSELNQLTENSEKLKLENAKLMDKLKGARGGGQMEEVDDKRLPLGTENLLSRVDNSGSVDRSDEGSEVPEKNSKSGGAKLRQLLSASPRTDAVAAG
ncbi:common plant regulatory factor 1-like isoform X1 [Diospyros lotus]|uniref:common plant regulatory factor 1-like isoform X1 n=1 Tax=Diospyros lotus TaxID=55363 RepID=UPI002251A37E|nr:common plant regulatory factor 1-like isoform X1 [Diospyros lotus]XP_052193204.1 common plant regulatory factor 1-like isoform X1 [Diospyros lotus]XP_052193205.1 common plant regulatory factor 1-like isoform X1 [Diospyros lotus]